MFGLNPSVILGMALFYVLSIGGVTVGAYVKGDHHGVEVTDAKWTKQEAARAERDHAAMLEYTQAFIDTEITNNQKRLDMEKNANDREKYISGIRIANGRLVAAAGGLFDRNGRPARKPVESAGGTPAGTASDITTAPTGCRLSDAITQSLLDLARDADAAVAYGELGHQYAVEVKAFRDTHQPKLGASP